MIRLLLAEDQELIRRALAVMLALEQDFEVVAAVGRGDEVAAAAQRTIRTSPCWTSRCQGSMAWRRLACSPRKSRSAGR